MSDLSEFAKTFAARGVEVTDPSLITKCFDLAADLRMSPEVLLNFVESFCNENISRGESGKFTLELFDQMQKKLRSTKVNAPRAVQQTRPAASLTPEIGKKRVIQTPESQPSKRQSQTPMSYTPESSLSQPGSSASSTASSFEKRNRANPIVVSYNNQLPLREEFLRSTREPLGRRCAIIESDSDFENLKSMYKYLYTNLDERARALERQLVKMQTSLCAFAALNPEELKPVGIPDQSVVWVCGRIYSESAVGKLSQGVIILEGSRRESGGRTTILEFDENVSYSLFSGQVVLVQGVNSSGRKMVAKRVICGASCSLPRSLPSRLLDFHYNRSWQGGAPLSIYVAAGPFTTSDNLNYNPLLDLMTQVIRNKPDVLVLIGPFVDVTHPILSSGNVQLDEFNGEEITGQHAATFQSVFIERFIRDGLSLYFGEEDGGGAAGGGRRGGALDRPTNIIVIPSLLDAHHEYVFPQPPFGEKEGIKIDFFDEDLTNFKAPYSTGDKKRVHFMSNPCMFRVNEILVGVCSQDILSSLAAEEISNNPTETHRLSRLASHILGQQSFSPVFPPSQSNPAQLDLRQSRHWSLTTSPDILITPSKLTPLIKDIPITSSSSSSAPSSAPSSTLFVNPGSIGRAPFVYAELHISPLGEDFLRDAQVRDNLQLLGHNVPSRCHAKIVKI